jgi:hypothetical protein
MCVSHPEGRPSAVRRFILVVAALTWLALVLPVGARAAGQLVTIVDPDTTNKVQVDGGKLRVGDGAGSLTVDGTVAALPALATHPWRKIVCCTAVLFLPPAGVTTLAITSLTLDNGSPGNTPFSLVLFASRSCTGPSRLVIQGTAAPNDTLHLDFPHPLVIQGRGSNWCVGKTGGGVLTGVGYLL